MSLEYNVSGNGNYCRYGRFQHLFFFPSYDYCCPTTATDDAPTPPSALLLFICTA